MIWNFIRHGQTDWNVRQLFQGRRDIPLNDTGRAQAFAAGREFAEKGISFARVYSSPLVRAKETATILTGLPEEALIIDDRLSEMDFGPLDGTTYDREAEELQAFFYHPGTYVAPAGAETFEQILERTASFLRDLRKEAVPGGDNILIQTHGGTLRALIVHLDRLAIDDYWKNRIDNCALVRYRCDGPDDIPHRLSCEP
ncbi:MAG: histidine phosphatase family protein [Lachnospiraceae bacterium]|nr:histidine phosphatase family protein [Lachnospiraceae bacterium]